jgi:hypothetical protein
MTNVKATIKNIILLLSLTFCGCVVDPNLGDGPAQIDPCQYHVYRHDKSGWLLTNPNITYIFWGEYWQYTGEAQYFQDNWMKLYSTDIVFDRLTEYGINNPILNANYYKVNTDFLTDSTSDVQVSFDDNKIVPEINKDIQEGTIPTPSGDMLYVIFLPPYNPTTNMIKNHDVGYHSNATYGSTRYTYAVIQYQNADAIDSVVSHETYEATTNPDDRGYWDDASLAEVADICDWVPVTIDGIIIQKVWSQATCKCL